MFKSWGIVTTHNAVFQEDLWNAAKQSIVVDVEMQLIVLVNAKKLIGQRTSLIAI